MTNRTSTRFGLTSIAILFAFSAIAVADSAPGDESVAKARELAQALSEYPDHAGDVAEFEKLATEIEATESQLNPGEDQVIERGALNYRLIRARPARVRSLGTRIAAPSTGKTPKQRTDSAKLEAKRYEREEAILDDAIDSSKAQYEDAREQFKKALRIIQQHAERQSQITQKMTQ